MHTPQCVFITGATGDFGKAFTKRFIEIGAKIIIHGRNPDKLSELVAEYGDKVYPICADITDKETLSSAISSLPEGFQEIDLLINNAGLALGLDAAHEANIDDWETMIDVNAKALVQMTRFVLPGMVERKRGHIINIGSTAGNYPYPGGNVYCASKAFVKQFSLSIRADLKGTNIRVTNIEPGQVETQFSKVRFKGDEGKAAGVYEGANSLQASDVAEAVFWAATLPEHCNINRIEMMPTTQSFGPLPVERSA